MAAVRYPPATWRPVRNTSGVMVQPTRGLIPHVQVGNGSLYGMFNNPASQVSSHLWLSKGGVFEQYVPFDLRAWAEAAGNPYWISVECEGFVTEDYTAAQIRGLGELFAWGMAEFGWKAEVTDSPNGYGIGTHRMGGAAWGGHSCPGDIRANRRGDILAAARHGTSTSGDLVFDDQTVTQLKDLFRAVLNEGTGGGQTSGWAGTEKAILSGVQANYNLGNALLAGLGWNKGNPSVLDRVDAIVQEVSNVGDHLGPNGAIVAWTTRIGNELAAIRTDLATRVGNGSDISPILSRLDRLTLVVVPPQ